MKNDGGEPGSAPQSEKWYKLKLGSSFKDQSSTKFCTLRYEFKPASIDKSQAGSLHKNKENRVTVEFLNNQPGKPKVSFEGSSEDYKDNDGVLFFDGETFRLERLHRAVKRLRHVRLPGESASATCIDARSPPLGKATNKQTMGKTVLHSLPVEKIDIGEPDSPDPKPQSRVAVNRPVQQDPFALPADTKAYEPEDDMDLDLEIDDDTGTPNKMNAGGQDVASIGVDINIPKPGMDDEIADVDDSDDEPGKGTNAAEALRAQVNAQGGQHSQESSSSSSSSGSGSSGSGSGSGSASSSSSSDSDADSPSSAGDIDI